MTDFAGEPLPGRGMWERMRTYWGPSRTGPPIEPLPPLPSPGPVVERRSLPTPLLVPAQGYVFDFTVHATFLWRAEDLYQDELAQVADQRMPYVTRLLRRIATEQARTRPPQQARSLEVAIQEELAPQVPWQFERDTSCRPLVAVRLDERVRQAMQPYSEQLIALDCEYEVHAKRVKYAEQRTRHWLEVLRQLVDDPLSGPAAHLAEEELAKVVREIQAGRRAESERDRALLQEFARGGDSYERAKLTEALSRRVAGTL